jgi:hypothetical protein
VRHAQKVLGLPLGQGTVWCTLGAAGQTAAKALIPTPWRERASAKPCRDFDLGGGQIPISYSSMPLIGHFAQISIIRPAFGTALSFSKSWEDFNADLCKT